VKIAGNDFQRVCRLLDVVTPVPGFPAGTFVGVDGEGGRIRFRLSSEVSAEVRLDVACPWKGLVAVDRRTLFPFVGCGSEEYQVKCNDSELELVAGRRRAVFPLVKVSWSYPEWPRQGSSMELGVDLVDALRCAGLCAQENPSAPHLACAYIEVKGRTCVWASNDLILSFASLPVGSSRSSMAFPLGLLEFLSVGKSAKVFVGDQVVGISEEGFKVWAQAPAAAWTGFPLQGFKKLLISMKKARVLMKCRVEDYVDFVERFSTCLGNVPKEEWLLELGAVGNKRIRGVVKAQAVRLEEELTVVELAAGKISARLNVAVLSSVLAFVRSRCDYVRFLEGEAVYYMQAGPYQFVLSKPL